MDNQAQHHQAYTVYQSFWKKNAQAVPGRPSLDQNYRQNKNSSIVNTVEGSSGGSAIGSFASTSFQDFQESVEDAWNSGDDEFCLVSNVKISKKVSNSAALSVIHHHRSNTNKLPQVKNKKNFYSEIIPKDKKTEALQRLAVQPLQLRNIKSNSGFTNDSHLKSLKSIQSKSAIYQHHTQFPGRPQPLRQSNSVTKCFIPSKEQDLFKIWLQQVFYPKVDHHSVPLDSWSGHCDTAIEEMMPENKIINVKKIPSGTTGKIQPLDVYGFRIWKNLVRQFSDNVVLMNYDLNLHVRNTIIKLQSLVHNQL